MSGWNLADLLEAIALSDPGAQAQVELGGPLGGTLKGTGERRFSWNELNRRANGIARILVDRGIERQGKIAQYLYNCPEYMESVIASFKASLVPVNTNYRYVEDELLYLWDNADVSAVVFHSGFAQTIERLRDKLPAIHTWLWVDDGSGTGTCPEWATSYEQAAEAGEQELELDWQRDGDDLWLLYTGGTTGMPKGVMWRQDDLWQIINNGRPEPFDLQSGIEGVRAQMAELLLRRVQLPACPLMHGTGFLTALGALLNGGSVVTLSSRRFIPELVLDAIQQEKVQALAIVGDAFARPLTQSLDAEPERWDVSSLEFMVSSGVMWSKEAKRGFLHHNPNTILADGLGSSESIGMGRSESTGDDATATASFELGDNACVLTEDGRKIEPGSGEVGRIAVSGHIPLGYYKDAEKTAATFPTIDGVRYAIAGDFASIDADGKLQLLGRGSVCINTGGEKVFPEEVEEALKQHQRVRDAVCVGVPDERFGQAIVAVVERQDEALAPQEEDFQSELIAWVKGRIAGYKAPKRVLLRESVGRAANGKADYGGLREWATEQLGLAEASSTTPSA